MHQASQFEHADAVGNGHRFFLIMRDVERHDPQLLLDAADLLAHLNAEFRIEVRKRLVQQEHIGIVGKCARDRDALLLPP